MTAWPASGSPRQRGARAIRAAARGRLPPRYAVDWEADFRAAVAAALRPGVRILDVGGGRRPWLGTGERPPDTLYAGLDLSAEEMQLAGAGGYDESWVGDIAERRPELEGRFDLVLSWQVLEHVEPLGAAVENMRAYLVPGGHFVALFSGAFSVFGIVNRVLPGAVGHRLVARTMRRDPDTVFPAVYDRCWDGALREIFAGWSQADIGARWRAANYFDFSAALKAGYLGYEEWAVAGDRRNLASHYLVRAVR